MEVNAITYLKSNQQSFAQGFTRSSKLVLAGLIAKLKLQGKTQYAQDCITLTQIIAEKAKNHTITDGLGKIYVFPHDKNIASSLENIRISPGNLKKKLSKIVTFLDNDNSLAVQVKKISGEISSAFKDADDDLLSAGWHGMEHSHFKGVLYQPKGIILAEQLAKLSLTKKNPAIIDTGIKLYNKIQTNQANCAIRMDTDGSFIIVNHNESLLRKIPARGIFGDINILNRLKKLGKLLVKIEKSIDKKYKKEQLHWEKQKLKMNRKYDNLKQEEGQGNIVVRFCLGIQKLLNRITQAKRDKYNKAIEETIKELP